MKVFIVSAAVIVLYTTFIVFVHDYNMHQRYTYRLKFVAEEAAAGAAQYIQMNPYGNGQVLFNRSESRKAADYLIRTNMELNDNRFPYAESYWTERVSYELEFFDDANTTFPYTYESDDGSLTVTLIDPSVVVTINAGKPRYTILSDLPNMVRTAAHTWKER